jgi:hypothetical protein
MTLFDLVEEVQEKTHLGEMEILDRVRRAWPGLQKFTPTQAALMANAIKHDREQPFLRAVTDEQLWGIE